MQPPPAGKKLMLPGATTFVVVESGADNNGTRVEFEITMGPGATGPPRHFHPTQEEAWTVLEGELSVLVEKEWRSLARGESFSIPPGTVHTLRNRSVQPVRFLDAHAPALDFEQYIEDLDRLTAAQKLADRMTPRTLIYGAMALVEHRPMQLSASSTRRATESVLALIGHLLGFRIRP